MRVFNAGAVGVAHLGPTGQSGLHHVALTVVRDLCGQLLHEFRPFRTRTDEAHLADQHVPQLRHLVQSRPAQQTADRRDARIASPCSRPDRCRSRHQCAWCGTCGPEDTAMQADAILVVKHGAARSAFHRDCDDSHNREAQRETQRREDDVERALRRQQQARLAEPLGENQPRWPQVLDRDLAGVLLID